MPRKPKCEGVNHKTVYFSEQDTFLCLHCEKFLKRDENGNLTLMRDEVQPGSGDVEKINVTPR